MIELVHRLWLFETGAFGLGLLLGVLLGLGRNALTATRAVLLGAVVLLVALVGAALSGLVPGRPGLWIDIAALLLLPYGVGSAAGCAVRRLAGWDSTQPATDPAEPAEPDAPRT
jgi:hypothetical protein